jgi:hypothetical protein
VEPVRYEMRVVESRSSYLNEECGSLIIDRFSAGGNYSGTKKEGMKTCRK